jgi:hypothetical protein
MLRFDMNSRNTEVESKEHDYDMMKSVRVVQPRFMQYFSYIVALGFY